MTTLTRTVPPEALELADLQTRFTVLAARAGEDAALFVGEPEFARHLARVEAFREAAQVCADRIAVLTGGQS